MNSCKNMTLTSHRDRIIKILDEHGETSISDGLRNCDVTRVLTPAQRHVPYRCRHIFCPLCRKERMSLREKKFLPRFGNLHRDHIAMVTLLFPPLRSLFDVPRESGLPASVIAKVRNGLPVGRVALEFERERYSRFIHKTFDKYLQVGGIEFEFVDLQTAGANKRRFIEAFPSREADTESVLVPHAHFAIAASIDGRMLSTNAVRELFSERYTAPYQVRVDSPLSQGSNNRPLTLAEAVTGWVRYSMKGFAEGPNARVVELARFDRAVPKHFYAFNRDRGGLGLRPPASHAIERELSERMQRLRDRLTRASLTRASLDDACSQFGETTGP